MTQPSTHRQALAGRTKRRLTLLFVAISALVSPSVLAVNAAEGASAASSFSVIVHPSNSSSSVTREFVAHAFLKRVTRWPDAEVIRPVDQHPDARVRTDFSGDVLRRSLSAMRSYWQQRIFSGRELPPPELDSDEAVVRFVASSPGAIGYVSSQAKLQHVKVISVR